MRMAQSRVSSRKPGVSILPGRLEATVLRSLQRQTDASCFIKVSVVHRLGEALVGGTRTGKRHPCPAEPAQRQRAFRRAIRTGPL